MSGRARSRPSSDEREAPATAPPARARGTELVALGVSAVASLALSARHLGLGRLPGCGLEGACDRLVDGAWGRLPLLDWPVAHVGSAHFLGLLAATWMGSGTATRRWARLGGLVSVGYLGVMATLGELCPYCLGTHLGNLAFVALSWKRPARAARTSWAYGAVAAAATLGLLGLEVRAGRAADEDLVRTASEARSSTEEQGFTGRHRIGAPDARVRIVIIGDFQCPDCRELDEEALRLVHERDDVSLSVKHFPLSTDCNPRARELGRNLHPNACWAARAAEAAAILDGTEGYWRMSRWLFERKGAFDPPTLERGAAELGLDAQRLLGLVRGPETEQRIAADIQEAIGLGIATTPMIFLNGIELRSWDRKGALARAVELVARAQTAGEPGSDRPPGALEKCLEDWRQQPRLTLPPAGRGAEPGEAPLLVVYGDYLDPTTRELDRRVRELLARHPGTGYSFRHYPLDPECASGVSTGNPGACRTAAAAVAAYRIAGADAASRLHERLFGAPSGVNDLVALARGLGLDSERFAAELEAPETLAAVRADVQAAGRLGITTIPALLVGGRYVPRWRFGDEPVLERILDEALATR